MKVNRLEAHDRLVHLKKDQESNVYQGAEDCLKTNSLSLAIQEKSPYVYIYAHARTADDGVTKKLYWQPRLSIPNCETNSYLFRAKSKSDIVDVIWMIPERHNWNNYGPGMVHEDEMIQYFIEVFQKNRHKLMEPHPDDLPDDKTKKILASIVEEKKQDIRFKKYKSHLILPTQAI